MGTIIGEIRPDNRITGLRKNRRHCLKPIVILPHCFDQLVARLGYRPSEEEVREILRRAALAQKSMVMKYLDGEPWVAPGVYINFDAGVALLVDEVGPVDRVFTVLTRANQRT